MNINRKNVKTPLVSIVVATYNSEKTLPFVLKSIKKQRGFQEKIELLVVDGGSTDHTLEIAESNSCQIIKNPRIEPVYGKYLAYLKCKGKYLLYLDHDEILENKNSIALKVSILESNNNIKTVIGSGYKNPEGYHFINNYINEFGDPFSFFVYGLSKKSEIFIKTMKNRYPVLSENQSFIILDMTKIKNLPLIELVAGGSMFDVHYIKKEYPQTIDNLALIPHLFYLLMSRRPFLAITKNDALVHYSTDTFKKYLNKINWRVKNNIYNNFNLGASGFSGRVKFQPLFVRLKKFLFIPYAYSAILPFYDAIYLVVTRKKIGYLLHVPLVIITASLILYHLFLKALGYNLPLRNYDESKVISNPSRLHPDRKIEETQ